MKKGKIQNLSINTQKKTKILTNNRFSLDGIDYG